MGRHHGGERGALPAVGCRVVGQDRFQAPVVHGDVDVRVGLHVAVSREMLAAVGHARQQQSVHQALGEHGHHARIAVERPVADHAAFAEVEVEHRREAVVHAAGAQLGGQHETGGRGGIGGGQGVAHPQFAEGAHRRQVREAIGAEALHAAAFVVHADQEVGPLGLDVGAQRGELLAVFPVAGEEDQTAHERVRQAAAIVGVQCGAGDVEHHGGMFGHGDSFALRSTTTKLAA